MPRVRNGAALLEQAWNAHEEARPLPADLRTVLERRLGADLSAVGVHTGPAADAAARAYGADAVASGSGVFFRSGAYRPDEPAGLSLLAHEVAHTVQQATAAVDGPGQPWEEAADRFAAAVVADRGAAGWSPSGSRVRVRPGPSASVQRHSSFEHRYLGDGPTQDLVDISLRTPGVWDVRLKQQIALMTLWQTQPYSVTEQDIARIAPAIRTLRLGPDNVLMTYGELNALPDYLANPEAIDTTGAPILMPILQVIRQESFNQLTALLTGSNPGKQFADAACAPWTLSLVNSIMETQGLDQLTAGLGPNHYQGLLARNACHFAPYAWHRWLASHLIARDTAVAAFKASGDTKAILTRQAWLYHGYADHFLQDSFAAGHLINKTLVMQWFIDWAATSSLLPVADWDRVKFMTPALQPGLSARQLYVPAYQGPSLDPQTVQEAATFVQRATGAGLRPGRQNGQIDAYQSYLTALTSAAAQLGTAGLHDYYNDNSLWVSSEQQQKPYRIWGDSTLLSGKDGSDGVRATSEAAQLSQQALKDILSTGGTSITIAAIRSRFPTKAGNDATSLAPLESWNDSQRGWCEENVFAPFIPTLTRLLLRLGQPTLGTVSQDQALGTSWNRQIASADNYAPVTTLTANGRVFESSNGWVAECDPVSGVVKQSIQLKSTGDLNAVLYADATNLYVGAFGRVCALPLSTAWTRPIWTSGPAGGSGDGPVDLLIVNGRMYTGCNGYVGELRLSDGVYLRNVLVGSSIGVGDYRTRLGSDGNLLYAGVHAYMYALQLADISQKPVWTSPALSGTFSYAQVTPLAANGRLFAASNGYAYELNAADGTIARFIRLASAVGTGDYTGTLATDGARLYVGVHGYTYALSIADPWTNDPLWTSPRLGGTLISFGPVSLVYTGDQLFAGSNGSAYEISLFNGAIKQSAQMTSAVGVGDYTTMLTTDGTALYAGVHGYAYRLQMLVRDAAPRAYWRLNQTSGTAVTEQRAKFPATANAVSWQPLPGAGGSAVFNGTTSSIQTAGPVLDTSAGASFTVTAWARIDRTYPGTGTVVSQDANITSAVGIVYSGQDQTWVFQRATSDTVSAGSIKVSAPAVEGVWTYLAGVYDAVAGLMSFYVNGTLAGVAPFTASQAFAAKGVLAIGRGQVNGPPAGFLPGAVREVRAYQRALDGLELAPGANAFWKLDEGSGTVVADATGNYPAAATQVAWGTEAGTGAFATFNGTSSVVAAPGPAVYTGPGGSYTIAAWVRLAKLSDGESVAVSQDATTISGFDIGYSPTMHGWMFRRAVADDGSGQTTTAYLPGPVPIGVWTQITGVYDAATSKQTLYINGVFAADCTSVFVKPFAAAGRLFIGQGKGADGFAGDIRDVRIYGQALTAQQVSTLIFTNTTTVQKGRRRPHHGPHGDVRAIPVPALSSAEWAG